MRSTATALVPRSIMSSLVTTPGVDNCYLSCVAGGRKPGLAVSLSLCPHLTRTKTRSYTHAHPRTHQHPDSLAAWCPRGTAHGLLPQAGCPPIVLTPSGSTSCATCSASLLARSVLAADTAKIRHDGSLGEGGGSGGERLGVVGDGRSLRWMPVARAPHMNNGGRACATFCALGRWNMLETTAFWR